MLLGASPLAAAVTNDGALFYRSCKAKTCQHVDVCVCHSIIIAHNGQTHPFGSKFQHNLHVWTVHISVICMTYCWGCNQVMMSTTGAIIRLYLLAHRNVLLRELDGGFGPGQIDSCSGQFHPVILCAVRAGNTQKVVAAKEERNHQFLPHLPIPLPLTPSTTFGNSRGRFCTPQIGVWHAKVSGNGMGKG